MLAAGLLTSFQGGRFAKTLGSICRLEKRRARSADLIVIPQRRREPIRKRNPTAVDWCLSQWPLQRAFQQHSPTNTFCCLDGWCGHSLAGDHHIRDSG